MTAPNRTLRLYFLHLDLRHCRRCAWPPCCATR